MLAQGQIPDKVRSPRLFLKQPHALKLRSHYTRSLNVCPQDPVLTENPHTLTFLFASMCMSVLLACICMYHMCSWCLRSQTRAADSTEHGAAMRVLGAKPGSSARTVNALTHRAIPPARLSYPFNMHSFNTVTSLRLSIHHYHLIQPLFPHSGRKQYPGAVTDSFPSLPQPPSNR